jgi:Lrp/AsnC family transcriptional regulator for asnA, asnC and gidA
LGTFTGITLNKDEDSSRIIEELKRYLSNGMLLYYWFLYFVHKMIARDHEHMRKLLEKIDTIQGIAKTDSMIELGCAFKRNISL